MANQTNINNNSKVINVGRTTPISPGPQEPEKSIPVVVSNTADLAIPVIEQQKIQSEVALSLLGIPRGEVALGIFSDVNTYDVNPTEWAKSPEEYVSGHGVKHLPNEAGALVQAPKNKSAVLSSKRFFRYQPGRVSAATFGVKCTTSPKTNENEDICLNPAIRKYGIYDNYDGYYWETRHSGEGDNFGVVRRTQSLFYYNPVPFNTTSTNNVDYRVVGKPLSRDKDINRNPRAIEIISDNRFILVEDAFDRAITDNPGGIADYLNSLSETDREKCYRDMQFALDAYLGDLQYGGNGHIYTNATTYRTALLPITGSSRQSEQAVHTALLNELKDLLAANDILNLNNEIDGLGAVQVDAVGGTIPDATDLQGVDWPNEGKSKIAIIFGIYKRYYGYLISEMFTQTNYVDYIKYKCYRDVGYTIDGYGRDLDGGGNAGTAYNMQNFYFNDIRRVTTDFGPDNDVVSFHIKAHTLLQKLISKPDIIDAADIPDGSGAWNMSSTILRGASAGGFDSMFTLFGLQDTYNTTFTELSNDYIANFSTPWEGTMQFGNREQFGDAFILRDGLLHVHAALYDPRLLKKEKRVRVQVVGTDTIIAAEGAFVEDQTIFWSGDISELGVYDLDTGDLLLDDEGYAARKIYAVKNVAGKRNNEFQLYDPSDPLKTTITWTAPANANGDFYIIPRTPFLFPSVYAEGTNERGGEATPQTWTKPDGMFPYMYTNSTGLERDPNGNTRDEGLPVDGDLTGLYVLGYVNTAIDTTGPALSILKQQIDDLNFRYNNWIKQNVDPAYYSVYEYRVPRSRYSQDKLDGEVRNQVYSDVATGEFEGTQGVVVRPGQAVTENGEQQVATSVWDIDFASVIMLKIEFSWYGAVGALFLAYVPVGNGEARWVRVHHLRASNQLKISSLGNATLPITYNVYGGGDENNFGINNVNSSPYSGPLSDYIIKYGASYYIDGGDRGTVRLYSHTNLNTSTAYGNAYTVPDSPPITIDNTGDPRGPYFVLPNGTGPTDRTFFMKAEVQTNNILDQSITVQWVEGNKLFTSAPIQGTTNFKLTTKRPSVVFGLKAKDNIFNNEGVGIRNRVQVYPTKLSAGNYSTGPLKLVVRKTPLFQPKTSSTGVFALQEPFSITSIPTPLPVPDGTSYLNTDGEFLYGWFLANVGTVFGKLSREGGLYYFQLLDVYTETVTLLPVNSIDPEDLGAYGTFINNVSNIGLQGTFLKDGVFTNQGSQLAPNADDALSVDVEKERLSSVKISTVVSAPIPDSGTEVTSFFISPGSEQFDLLSYFDYNKDYLSYPLTDTIESIYVTAQKTGENNPADGADLNISMTWEEQ